ncbi:MAG: hypothetical protein CVU06_01430 [Bacteroidetes bacterium HGW-Bacteroidetes-22]|nr:MAG: hypothetical protein CVU06_01430 [Bacteroidetes bacterium HGW-Bacteroidetes-22]
MSEIEIRALKKHYKGGVEALKTITLNIERGSFFALLGPNGAGKSTLVGIMTTLIRKDAGDIIIGGLDPEKETAAIQRYIGAASQENELDPAETPFNLLRFQGRLFGLHYAESRERAEELIIQFGLENEKHKKTASLSGGNKRRLHCALALVHRPRVLFLDEPTVGMDPLARETFWHVITSLNHKDGVTIMLTTQYLEEADRHASEMAMIIDGTIHFQGTVQAFKQNVNAGDDASLEDNYLKYTKSLNNTKYINS